MSLVCHLFLLKVQSMWFVSWTRKYLIPLHQLFHQIPWYKSPLQSFCRRFLSVVQTKNPLCLWIAACDLLLAWLLGCKCHSFHCCLFSPPTDSHSELHSLYPLIDSHFLPFAVQWNTVSLSLQSGSLLDCHPHRDLLLSASKSLSDMGFKIEPDSRRIATSSLNLFTCDERRVLNQESWPGLAIESKCTTKVFLHPHCNHESVVQTSIVKKTFPIFFRFLHVNECVCLLSPRPLFVATNN